MNQSAFLSLLERRILILDGATGTELQKAGMPHGVCPERWILEHPEALQTVQRAYFEAGADVVYSCTFGGNPQKLEEYGFSESDVISVNERLMGISRAVCPKGCFVAGDISSSGSFVQPFGPLAFDEAVRRYALQVRGLVAGGADVLVIETMMDIQETRAALIAARETCDLPVLVSMTFNEDGRTLTGTSPEAAIVTLQALGAAAVGCNCSTGPAAMKEMIARMRPLARVPLFAKPNAGLPVMRDGQTFFEMTPEPFARETAAIVDAGAALLGGCCGTTPEHIAALKKMVEKVAPPPCTPPTELTLSSARATVTAHRGGETIVIGERINPTGKKKLQAALREKDWSEVRRLAFEQVADGAHLLDVNTGMPGIDEKETMLDVLHLLSIAVDAPLCLDSSNPDVLEAALRQYPGRALINSISMERKKIECLLPVAAKYGAAFIALPLSDDDVPVSAEARKAHVNALWNEAQKYGYKRWELVVDGLVMAVSSDMGAAQETLKTVAWASGEFGANTVLGLSNVSFGLPERKWLNTAFLTMAIQQGVSFVIANPMEESLRAARLASDVLACRDAHALRYIGAFANAQPSGAGHASDADQVMPSAEVAAGRAVLEGSRERVADAVRAALAAGVTPYDLVSKHLIPSIMEAGNRFEKGVYFLPQLMLCAEAMENAFEVVEPLLKEAGHKPAGTVVLATVKGDIHDIGKNIVALMLRNHGFRVLDLGKDVSAEHIVETARSEGAEVIGLSALMTTTMTEMATVIQQVRAAGLSVGVMVGGAVVTQAYADEIGADAYAADAVGAARAALSLVTPSGEKV